MKPAMHVGKDGLRQNHAAPASESLQLSIALPNSETHMASQDPESKVR
jgi:hypothetical protein